jgi:nitrogen fixation protein NifB
MHAAVAPACNIQCNYCNRKYDCVNESRPGVVSQLLTPEQAAMKVAAVAARIPQLSVLGIAGPGDALANAENTFETLRLVRLRMPDILPCLATNGLALPENVDRIVDAGVEHVTITINALDPEVGARIYAWVRYGGRRLRGAEGARILIERQLLGLQMLADRGVLVKVNSVLVPGINEQDLIEVNRAVKARGAFLHNIMPLLSAPEYGTIFGKAGQRPPTARELERVQDACAGGASLMRHCRQCRADAVGLLCDDRCGEFTLDQVERMPVLYNIDTRRAFHQKVEIEREAQRVAAQAATTGVAAQAGPDLKLRAAVATRGAGRINQHFGHAKEFSIYQLAAHGAEVTCMFVGHRRVDDYCQGGWGDDDRLPAIVDALADCHAVLAARIGTCPRGELAARGIEAVDARAHEFIESGLLTWFGDYRARIIRGDVVHRPRGDAPIRAVARAPDPTGRFPTPRVSGPPDRSTPHSPGASHADLSGTRE